MKDILELIGAILLVTVLFLFLADTKITFSPFAFKCAHWMKAVGWVIIAIGVAFVVSDASEAKYAQGLKDGSDYTVKELEKSIKEAIKGDSAIKDVKVNIEIKHNSDK